ncbi:MAG: PH domain-containing protein [Acidimicrobiales bacterium]
MSHWMDLLDEGEDSLYCSRPHWAFFAGPLVLTIGAIGVAAFIFDRFPKAPVVVAWVIVALIAIPALYLLGRLVRWASTGLVVTDRRIVLRTGVLGRQIVNLRLQRIADVHCAQRLRERLVGAGRIVLDLQGDEGPLAVECVRRPRTVQRLVSRRLGHEDVSKPVEWNPPRERPGDLTPPTGTPRAPGVAAFAEDLLALEGLRRQGLITDEEFAGKKAELLSRI